VDDPDVGVLDEEDDGGSGVGSADADVVKATPMAKGDLALVVDDVAADAVVVVELAAGAGSSLGQGVVDGGRGGAVWQRAVRARGPRSTTVRSNTRRSPSAEPGPRPQDVGHGRWAAPSRCTT
jgi:hypothetical protein